MSLGKKVNVALYFPVAAVELHFAKLEEIQESLPSTD